MPRGPQGNLKACLESLELRTLNLDAEWLQAKLHSWKKRFSTMDPDDVESCVFTAILSARHKIAAKADNTRAFAYTVCQNALLNELEKSNSWRKRNASMGDNCDRPDARETAAPNFDLEMWDSADAMFACMTRALDTPPEVNDRIARSFKRVCAEQGSNFRKYLLQALMDHGIPRSTCYRKLEETKEKLREMLSDRYN